MKIKFIIPLLSFLVLSCSTKDSDEDIVDPKNRLTINNVSPSRVKIGDTITISGNRLDLIKEMMFFNENQTHINDQAFDASKSYFITHTEEEITLVMPWFYHENVTIDFMNLDNTTWDLEVYGMMPIFHEFESIQQIKLIDENVAYLRNANNVYKSVDGFHNWDLIFDNGIVTDFFFLDENNGWVATVDGSFSHIYYTEDAGDSFELISTYTYTVSNSQIRKMQFTSKNKGYFVTTGNNQMYSIENNEITHINERFPNLGLDELFSIGIFDFNFINDDLFYLIPNDLSDPLVRVSNETTTLNYFEFGAYTPPQFFGNTGFYLTHQDMYKSVDNGLTWEKMNTFENYPQSFNFMNNQHGFVYIEEAGAPPYIFQSFDGGTTWEKYYTFTRYATSNHLGKYHDLSETNGLFGMGRSLFKLIE